MREENRYENMGNWMLLKTYNENKEVLRRIADEILTSPNPGAEKILQYLSDEQHTIEVELMMRGIKYS